MTISLYIPFGSISPISSWFVICIFFAPGVFFPFFVFLPDLSSRRVVFLAGRALLGLLHCFFSL